MKKVKAVAAPVVKIKVSRVPVSELNVVKTAARLMTTKLVSTEIAYVQRVLGPSATQAQLDEKRVQLDVDEQARTWLAEQGYDPEMGARPMARVIQEKLKKPLAEMILFGELAEHGGLVHVTVEGGELHLATEAELA